VVQLQALAAQQDQQASITEPADGSLLPQSDAHDRIVRPHAAIAHRTAVHADGLARPSLAHLMVLAKVCHGLPPGGGLTIFLN
jgi:hypothetical protein